MAVASDITFQSLICVACGRSFAQPNAYSNHIGSCRAQKKRMASALEVAKEKYRNKKARLDTIPTPLLIVGEFSGPIINAPEAENVAIEVSNLVL